MELAGRTALVTGASGGLGRAIATALAARGAALLLSGRRVDVLTTLASELNSRPLPPGRVEPDDVMGVRAEPDELDDVELGARGLRADPDDVRLGVRAVPADLADPEDVERLADAAEAAAVDIVVANAAVPASGSLFAKSTDDIDRALAVNLRAPIVLARRLVPGMQARGRGHLVFVSSLSGKAGAPGTTLYAATKFGLRGLALSLREDLRDTGVGVSGVYPGFIRDAGMFHRSRAKLPAYVGTKTPEDVASAVVRAIEEDRAEIDVAPLGLRVGTALAGLAPETAGRVQRRLGGAKVADAIARGQQSF